MRASSLKPTDVDRCNHKGRRLLVAAIVATGFLQLVSHRLRTGRSNKADAGMRSGAASTAGRATLRVVAEHSVPEARSTREPESEVPDIFEGKPFRVQFLGGADGQGPPIVKEVKVCAPNAFAAVRQAELDDWPPGANGFRLLDGGGHDVFWRRKPERRSVERSREARTPTSA